MKKLNYGWWCIFCQLINYKHTCKKCEREKPKDGNK